MGLFDFLHGKEYESEATQYMKERNKEYAKKCAEYERQEILGTAKHARTNYSVTINKTTTENHAIVKGTVSTGKHPAVKGSLSNLFRILVCGDSDVAKQMNEILQMESECDSSSMSDAEKQSALKQRLQEKYKTNTKNNDSPKDHKNISNSNCETGCSQEYDKTEMSLFEIETVQKNGRVLKLCGKIMRGRFVLDDDVVVKSNGTAKETRVLQILRQGKEIDYANLSSGKIVISIPVDAAANVQPGDKLTKDSIG